MDFNTAHASNGIPIRVNGKAYSVPRFLLPDMEAWAAEKVQEQEEKALAQLKDEDSRARFLLFFAPPAIDVLSLITELKAPAGIRYILSKQLRAAGVPDTEAAALIQHGDPKQLRDLVRQIGSADAAAAQLETESADPGRKADPLVPPPPSSGGSPETGELTSPSSEPSTPAPTRAA